MSTANAEEIYERYIKALPADLRLRLVEIVVRELAGQTSEKVKEHRRDLMDLHGLGKEIWDGVDAQAYVNHLRIPDALQLGAVLSAGCEAFLTNDYGLRRITDLRILLTDELEL